MHTPLTTIINPLKTKEVIITPLTLKTTSFLFAFFAQLSVVILLFSPLISLAFSFLILGIFSEHISNNVRRFLGVSAALSLAVIVSSRAYGISISDDFANSYYDNYIGICSGNYDNFFAYGKGLEMGLPILFFLISIFYKSATPNVLIFLVSFFSSLIFYVWMEQYGLEYFSQERKGITVAFSILMLGLFLSSLITRQFIASIWVLYAIFSKDTKKIFIFVLLGTLFHITAVLTYLIGIWLWKTKTVGFILALILFLPLANVFEYFTSIASADAMPLISKLDYWNINTSSGALDLEKLRIMTLVAIASIPTIFSKKFRAIPECNSCLYLFWGFFVIYLVLLPFSMMSLRFTLLVNSLLLGWFLAVFLKPINFTFVKMFFVLYLLYKVSAYATLTPDDEMRLWEQFNWWGWMPGYFIM